MNKQLELAFMQESVKLREVSVYNWGSFKGLHTLHIHDAGTLITGENGAGKSTIIDALMTLLMPAGAAEYNIAATQGKRNDRNLISYMRGSFGSTSTDTGQVSKVTRSNSVITVIKANYEFTQSLSKVVLLGVFYIQGDSNTLADVKRIYAVANEDISIKDLITSFGNFERRRLTLFLETVPNIKICDNNFSEYQSIYMHQLRMDNKNAPALLSRALGLKRIDDLTKLIRELVLEPGNVRTDAESIINNFETLKQTHERMVDAQNRVTMLTPLRQLSPALDNASAQEQLYAQTLEVVDSYVDRYALTYYQKSLQVINEDLSHQLLLLDNLKAQISEAQIKVEQCHTDLVKQGGERSEQLLHSIEQQEQRLKQAQTELTKYNQKSLSLGLDKVLSLSDFTTNQNKIRSLLESLSTTNEKLDQERTSIAAQGQLLLTQRQEYEEQLRQLKLNQGSNLPLKYLQFRQLLTKELNLSSNSLVYTAELMEIKPAQAAWQGAIERALGGIRHTLMISKSHSQKVLSFVNQRNNNLHVRIVVVPEQDIKAAEFMPGGFLEKLNFKDHSYTNFLKQYLNRYDLSCVTDLKQFEQTQFSMTVEGFIHKHDNYFEKNDLKAVNDRREWCLGFSNADKIHLLEQDFNKILEQIAQFASQTQKLTDQLKKNHERIRFGDVLLNYENFTLLDTISPDEQIARLRHELDVLMHDPSLAKLQDNLDKAKAYSAQLMEQWQTLDNQRAIKEQKRQQLQEQIAAIEKAPQQTISESCEQLLKQSLAKLKLKEDNVFLDSNRRQLRGRLSEERTRFNNEYNKTSNLITGIINRFYEKWSTICADWGRDLEARAFYLEHLKQVEEEGLPKLVDEFKTKLNLEVTQSIATLVNKISSEISSIKDKIARINLVLERAEFSPHTYLAISPREISNPIIQEFNKDTNHVMGAINSQQHEQRYKDIEKVIGTLRQALTSRAIDMTPLLDTRQRMTFLAKVVNKDTGETIDTLNSSSGKSGGEKESFAGSVLAASLAYVLTPQDGEFPIYATVFLDEAFSNTSDEVSKRVLKIFSELKLHVNLITPFKNIDLAREYARSIVIMQKDEQSHSSSMCELSWEQLDAQKRSLHQQVADRQFEELGIKIEELH